MGLQVVGKEMHIASRAMVQCCVYEGEGECDMLKVGGKIVSERMTSAHGGAGELCDRC